MTDARAEAIEAAARVMFHHYEGERDRARDLAAELEADNARLTEERDERQHSADWAWRCANGYGERAEAAEARARRAEDALREVSGYSDNCGCSRCQQVRHVLSDAALSDGATPSDTAGLREALERLLEFPNWTYIDGVLTAVVLPEGLRAVLSAHPADAPAEAPEPSGDVVEQVARVLGARTEPLCGECSVPGSSTDTLLCGACDARALADAGLLADPAETERRENVAKAWAERWLGERDRARDLAADLEADNARLTEALREIQAAIGLPAVVCGQVSMPVRYEKARKAADAALSDGATR